jgi:acyl-CoA synthetase (AMP-forming)/AMP-acid ligase II
MICPANTKVDSIVIDSFSLQILEAAVTSVPDDVFGELVIAVIALRTLPFKQGSEQPPVADLLSLEGSSQEADLLHAMRQFLADKLAPYKQPRRYVLVPSIPRNALGKVGPHPMIFSS